MEPLDEHELCRRGAHGAEEVVQLGSVEKLWEWSRGGGYTVCLVDITGGKEVKAFWGKSKQKQIFLQMASLNSSCGKISAQ